jgi:FixJ family two-component response regulator
MEGHSNKVIARDLRVAEPTVKSHVKNILNKERRLDAPSFAEGELLASHQQDGKYSLDRTGRRK